MKRLLIALSLLLSSCGHNVMTNYSVKGVDLSVPIFGYPFGLRMGVVQANQNMLRGNATYTMHSANSGPGGAQDASVIQFSSKTQINEGNVEKILQSPTLSEDVKRQFIKDFLADQDAPSVLPASTNTPSTVTATSGNTKMHERQFDRPLTLFEKVKETLKNGVKNCIKYAVNTAVGRIAAIVASILCIWLAIRIVYAAIRKIVIQTRS